MHEPADILYLAAGLGTGGTERHLFLLLRGLQGKRFRPRVWNTGEGGEAERQLVAAGIEVMRAPFPSSIRQTGRCLGVAGALWRRRPALVHSYLYGRHWLDALACRLAGVPYVASRRNLAHWRQGAVLGRERWRDGHSAAIVANALAVAAVAEQEGADPRRIVVIPNGVELPAATPGEARQRARAELGLDGDARVVGSVASLKPIKDPATLLSAFRSRAGARRTDRLVLVGGGPLEASLRFTVAEWGMDDMVLFVGRHPDPARLLPAFDLFVLASRSEGCSNALLEAMAAGVPVIATAVGGNREAIEDGVSGRLVPPGLDGRLAEAIDSLLDDTGEAARLGGEASRRAQEKFSVRAMVEAHASLYERLLNAARGEGRHAA